MINKKHCNLKESTQESLRDSLCPLGRVRGCRLCPDEESNFMDSLQALHWPEMCFCCRLGESSQEKGDRL